MATSQNGWSARRDLPIRPLVIAGEPFSPGILDHPDVYDVLKYVAEQLNKRVERIYVPGWHAADDWGFYFRANANNPNSLSNHSSGTAFDYNATRHPNGVPTRNTFTRAQIDEIHKILAEVNHVVRWGGDYNGTPDAMHFEINAGPAAVKAAAQKVRNMSKPVVPYPKMGACDLVFWNMNNGARPRVREALNVLKKTGARTIVLNECAGHWALIKDWAKDNGFSIVTGEGEIGAASCILVKHRSGSKSSGTKTINVEWDGPKGKEIEGRALYYEKAVHKDRRVLTIGLHQVWGPNRPSNDDAKKAIVQQIRKWIAMNPGWDIYIGPDWNESRSSTEPYSPANIAKAVDGRILAGGEGVDYILFRRALKPTEHMARVSPRPRVKTGPSRMGSDHPPIGVVYS